jgi:F0F1-type ATP synthase alpha subunit
VKFALQTGERVIKFFDQHADDLVAENAQIFLFSLLWRGFWQNKTTDQMKQDLERLNESYKSDQKISEYINTSVSEAKTFNDLLKKVDEQRAQIATLFNLNP